MNKKLFKILDKEVFFGLKPLEVIIGAILLAYACALAIHMTSR